MFFKGVSKVNHTQVFTKNSHFSILFPTSMPVLRKMEHAISQERISFEIFFTWMQQHTTKIHFHCFQVLLIKQKMG